MGKIDNYEIDFIRRTNEILKLYYPEFEEKKEREATFLLNCLLGLIVTISENEKRNSKVLNEPIDDDFLQLIPDKIGFLEKNQISKDFGDKDLTDLSLKVGHKLNLKGKDVSWFINKIRNGIAHQNIKGINENGKWVGVRLINWNIKYKKNDFEIIFSIGELKDFALKFSEMYLNKMSSKRN